MEGDTLVTKNMKIDKDVQYKLKRKDKDVQYILKNNTDVEYKFKKDNSMKNKLICSIYEVFRFILFPLVLFIVLYISKISNLLHYTNNSNTSYNITLISLIITNVILSIIEKIIYQKINRNGFEYFIIGLLTLILTVMFFLKKILLKNTFIVIFAINVFLIVFKLLWENIFIKLHKYCYPPEVTTCYNKCKNINEQKCYEECY